ncbi:MULTISPECIES: OmpA family protein [unclassified Pseudomonas]|uniref:OmpA family protein n=1 Tax=unclassified Pseudomonas TaxID=196821 RepID=UPI0017834F6D|nr:OmpA family protein [Pseudomonas sp. CFBP 8771]MBD8622251.1 OmpA family protein [Pseudomonas sp. CFBP 13727]
MRQRYIALLSVFASLPALAMNFQTRLENVEWKVAGDQFECRLGQPVTNFGSAEFVRRAGEQAVFRLTSASRLLGTGSATLIAAAAPWQPGRGDINLGSVRLGHGEALLTSSQSQASGLINGLLEGRMTLVRSQSGGGQPVEIRLLSARFGQAFGEYQACAAKLMPMNYDQIRLSEVGFPRNLELDGAAKARLDKLLAFMKADPSVNHVQLDGHSDNSGNRLVNRDLSRRRAMAVQEYLLAHGLSDSQITLRFHGESYPLVTNNTAANRARNRRVSIELSRAEAAPNVTPATDSPAVLATEKPPAKPL